MTKPFAREHGYTGSAPYLLHASLYREHAEELSFLFEQRAILRQNPEMNWTEFHPSEERIEAHLDGLFLGGQPALEVCAEKAASGDPGILQATLRLNCRHRSREGLLRALGDADHSEPEVRDGIVRALHHECPEEWSDLPDTCIREKPELLPLVLEAQVRGCSGIGLDSARAIRATGTVGTELLLEALGYSANPSLADGIHGVLMKEEHPATQAAAVRALQRLGDPRGIGFCRDRIPNSTWVYEPLGLSGDPSCFELVLDAFRKRPSVEAALALGLFGRVESVESLSAGLAENEIAEACGQALRLIVGYGGPGDEARTLIAPAEWKEWWAGNRSRFPLQRSIRAGMPAGRTANLGLLTAANTSAVCRKLLYEELRVRYRMRVPWHPDLFVKPQRRLLRMMSSAMP